MLEKKKIDVSFRYVDVARKLKHLQLFCGLFMLLTCDITPRRV